MPVRASTLIEVMALATLLVGCPGGDDKSSDSSPVVTDDSDSSACVPTDEVCDGEDNDCDGDIDEGFDPETWYLDEDGDGYGGDADSGCEPPSDAMDVGGDCDDGDDSINPDATETCDDVDNDCNGLTDDQDPSIEDQTLAYRDHDGDGYGAEPGFLFCEPPSGYVSNADDCDDDDDDVAGPSDWYLDADGDGYGAGAAYEACTRPTGYAANDTDCDDSARTTSPAESEVCDDGVDNNCDDSANDCRAIEGSYTGISAEATITGSSTYYSVWSTSADTDGDGRREVIAGSPYAGGYGTGGIYAFEKVKPGSALTNSDAIGFIYDDSSRYIGYSMNSPGDIDGDGYDDIVATATSDNYTWILGGPLLLAGSSVSTTAFAAIDGLNASTNFTTTVSGADLDSDGYADIVVGGPEYSSSYSYEGATCMVSGRSVSGLAYFSRSSNFCVFGGVDEAYSGRSTAVIGDVSGDGIDEIAITAYNYNFSGYAGAGAVALFSGDESGDLDLSDAYGLIVGDTVYQYVGVDVAGPGDVDNDGYADVVLSSGTDGSTGKASYGAAFLFQGGALSGTRYTTRADSTFIGTGASAFATFVAGAGNLDGDDYQDLVMSDFYDSTYASSGGRAWVFYGSTDTGTYDDSDADATIYGSSSSIYLGFGPRGVGDLDADGYDDLMVGSYGKRTEYIFFGGAL